MELIMTMIVLIILIVFAVLIAALTLHIAEMRRLSRGCPYCGNEFVYKGKATCGDSMFVCSSCGYLITTQVKYNIERL